MEQFHSTVTEPFHPCVRFGQKIVTEPFHPCVRFWNGMRMEWLQVTCGHLFNRNGELTTAV
jgi:hypothetical protein